MDEDTYFDSAASFTDAICVAWNKCALLPQSGHTVCE